MILGHLRTAGLLGLILACSICVGAPAGDSFSAGREAYGAGDFAAAARHFRDAVQSRTASGALLNLGNAEWQLEKKGEAILAWERALWANPFDRNARNNLRFARETLQLEAPELSWYEVGSTWLPADWWAWMATVSLWLVVAMTTLPGIFRWRKSAWHQALAALGLGVLLLALPANYGALTRSRVGFVREKDTPLRLTPTAEGEPVTRLAEGDPGRWVRARGKFVYIRTSRAAGWIERDRFDLVCAK